MNQEPDFNPEDSAQVERELAKEFVRPAERFRGADLWPFTPGSRDIFAMVQDDADPILYRALAFVYLHLRRGASDMETDLARHIIPFAWHDLDLFRAKVYAFRSELSDEDLSKVYAIAAKELNLAALSEIVGSPPEVVGTPKKKVKTTTPRKSAGKSTPQPKS